MTEDNLFDPVDRPAHYAEGRAIEPISVILDWQLGYLLGSVLKYVSRAGRKQDEIEDLRKAQYYLNKRIAQLENK